MQTSSVLDVKGIFLKELRTLTAPAHKKLEETDLSKVIVSDKITIAEYIIYLKKMLAVISDYEKSVLPILKPFFADMDQRIKSSLLEKDLISIKGALNANEFNFKGFGQNISVPYAMGCMYVIEGSTLGGKFIYKNIESSLSFNAEKGASYFNGYGAETGALWKNFLEQFCEYAISTGSQSEIIKGAEETFSAMYDLLNN